MPQRIFHGGWRGSSPSEKTTLLQRPEEGKVNRCTLGETQQERHAMGSMGDDEKAGIFTEHLSIQRLVEK